MEGDEPSAKRKKHMSGKEIIEKLESNENDVKKAVAEIIEELCPFDVDDQDALQIEDRLERLDRVNKLLEKKVYKLRKDVKERKYRHKPESLEETMISSSQYSIFDSQELGEAVEDIENEVIDMGDGSGSGSRSIFQIQISIQIHTEGGIFVATVHVCNYYYYYFFFV